MFIDYNNAITAQKTLSIKDIGNCAIEGVNDDGLYFYMIITTIRGEVTLTTFGPVIPDLFELPNNYCCSLTRMKFDQRGLKIAVSKWLTGKKPGKCKPITEAKEINKLDAINQFRDLKQYYYVDDDLSARLYSEIMQNLDEEDEDFE